jgi:hypothetical protein
MNVLSPSLERSATFRKPAWARREHEPFSAASVIAAAVAGGVLVGAASTVGVAAGVAVVVCVAIGLFILSRPVLGACCLVAVVPALSGLRRGLPVPGFRVSEVAVVAIGAVVLWTAPLGARTRWRTFDWLAFAYVVATVVIGTVDVVATGASFTGSALRPMFGPLQFFLIYRAASVAFTTPDRRRRGLRWVLLTSVPISLLGILQQLNVPGVRPLIASITGVDLSNDWSYSQLPRATGPFPHWHMLGGYLLVVALLAVALLLDGNRAVLSKRALIGILCIALVAMAETVTIAPVLGFVAGVVLLASWAGKVRRVATWIAVAVAASAVLFGPVIQSRYNQQFHQNVASASNPLVPSTINYRYDVWTTQYLPALSGHWVLGYGPDLPPTIDWKYTESLYIALMLRGGIALLAVYGALIWALAAAAKALRFDRDRERAVVARTVLALVLVLLPLHLVMPYFIDTGLPHLLWGLSGLMLAASRRDVLRA